MAAIPAPPSQPSFADITAPPNRDPSPGSEPTPSIEDPSLEPPSQPMWPRYSGTRGVGGHSGVI